MKLEKLAGATSEIWQVFVRDSSSTTGAGLTGLVFNSASLTAYYHRDTDTTATAISLVTMTVGTFTSSGFKEIDSANMPGWYQFCPPNAAIAAGAKSCAFHLKGATNMAPLPIEVQLTAINPDSATAFMTSVATVTTVTNQLTAAQIATGVWQDTTAGDFTAALSVGKSVMNGVSLGTGLTVNAVTGLTASNLDTTVSSRLAAGSYTAPSNLTAAQIATGVWQDATAGDFATTGSIGKSLFTSGILPGASGGLFIAGTNAATTITTGLTTTFTGNLTGSVASVTGLTASDVGSIKAKTDNLPASPASTTNITAGTITTVSGNVNGNVTGSVGSVTGLTASNLDATISSRLAAGGYTAPLDAAGTRAAVGLASANLDTQLDALPTNAELATALGTADDAVLAQVALVKAKTDNLPASPAATGDIPSAAAVADAVWDEARADHTTSGTFGQGVASVQGNVTGNVGGNVSGSVGSLATQAKADVNAEADTALADAGVTTTVTGRIDAAISTRLASGSYTAPDNTSITAIKAKTDNLPSDPADASDIATALSSLASTLTTIAGYIDTEVAQIKAKTDNLPASPAAAGDIPTAAENATALLDLADAIEIGLNVRKALRVIAASAGGKLSGAATSTNTFRNAVADDTDRMVATVDSSGNRSSITYNLD